MKTALTLMAVAAMVAAGGCNKKNEPEMPEDYGNACIVGHPLCSAQVRHAEPPDEAVAADQTKAVGGRTVVPGMAGAAASVSIPSPGTGAGGSDAAIAAVKAELAAALEAAKADDIGRACDGVFASDVSKVMKRIAAAGEKVTAFRKLVQSKFGPDASDLLKDEGDGMEAQGDFNPDDWKQWTIDQYKFSSQDGKVTVTSPVGKRQVYAKTAQGWKMEIPTQGKAVLELGAEMAEAMAKVCEILTSEINAGKLTKETAPARANELGDQYIKPVAAKLLGGMMEGMGVPSATPDAPAAGF